MGERREDDVRFHHVCDEDGSEVDGVVELGGGRVAGIGVKAALTPTPPSTIPLALAVTAVSRETEFGQRGDSADSSVSCDPGGCRMARVVPTCLALILCDSVRRPMSGGDPTVVRAFVAMDVPALPTASPPLTVLIHLTDGNGHTAMELVVEHVPAGQLEPEGVAASRFTVTFADPNVVLEHELILRDGIYLEKSGRYRLRLTADGTTIVQRYFIVQLAS